MRADLRQMGTVRPMLPLAYRTWSSRSAGTAPSCCGVCSPDWIETLAAGVATNEADPGSTSPRTCRRTPGRFWDDYVNWERIPEFERFARESDVARLAAELMASETVQLFHDHVLVKEPGTPTVTPWHSDRPYCFVDGIQTVSFWIPLDPVTTETTLRLVAGSHRWEKDVLPVRWLRETTSTRMPLTTSRCPTPTAIPIGTTCSSGHSNQDDAIAFHLASCMAPAGIPAPDVGEHSHYGLSAMMPTMPRVPVAPLAVPRPRDGRRRPTPVPTGSRS